VPRPISSEEIAGGARLLWNLPSLLRHPLSLADARATLGRRLEGREANFLSLLGSLYSNAASPYRSLLRLADCDYEDLQRLVTSEGVEGTLLSLYRHGVYLTVDELKGRRAVVRGSSTLDVHRDALRNLSRAARVPTQSSGSRGTRTAVAVDLAFIRDCAANISLYLGARGGTGWQHALWSVPGSAVLARLLEYAASGAPPARWFSQVDPGVSQLHPRYRWSARLLRWPSLLAKRPLPRPEHVALGDPLRIARWMEDVLRSGGTPHLHTFVTPAVMLCKAAEDAGINLEGARFTLTGEQLTSARLGAIRAVGGEAWPRYGAAECTMIAYGCLAPETPDDSHVFHDMYALVQPGQDDARAGLSRHSLLVSSLSPHAPLMFLNVSLGDQGELKPMSCGCPLARLGWGMHLKAICSFEKLTVGGVNLLDIDVINVLEEVLPERFGGGPTDYQLLEDESVDGQPRLRLLVHPALGPLDPETVADVFLAAIGRSSGAERVMELQWRQAGLLRVERTAPRMTASGKILHLHREHR
jgi:hypothetical protein